MADYHSLLTRAVANLPSAGTSATRQAIYDRARKALLTQLRTLRPPLPESDIAREEDALDAAIAQIEARFAPEEATETVSGAPAAGAQTGVPSQPSQQSRSPATAALAQSAAQPAAIAAISPARPPQRPAPPAPNASSQTTAPLPAPGAAGAPAPAPRPPSQGAQPIGAKIGGAQPAAAGSALQRPAAAPAKSPLTPAPAGSARDKVDFKDAKGPAVSQLAARDLAKAVKAAKTDDAVASAAPPVVATRLDEPVQSASAPEVQGEGDRAAPSARLEAESQRPVAPVVEAGKPRSLLWIAAAVVLGVVAAVAVAAIAMRQKPQDLAIKPPPVETPAPGAPQPQAKIAERVQSPPSAEKPASPPAAANEPQADHSVAQGGPPTASAPPAEAQNPPAPAPSAGRAAMLVASADNPQKPVVSLGSTVWSTIPPAPGQPATVAVKAEADIPDLKMHATMTLRKNTDPTLQATHTIDLKFAFADGAPITGFKDVGLPQMRKEDSTAAETLNSVKVKISDVYFLIALAKSDQDVARNIDLMQTRAWFDFPLLLNDNRIAKIVFQKSADGAAMLQKAFDAWK